MKKIATLLLAAGLVFGMSTGASAIDFKAKGEWIMSFDYGQNGGFTKGNGGTAWNGKGRTSNTGSDQFQAGQRARLQLTAVASEALSGVLWFETGDTTWGGGGTAAAGHGAGGALGSDGISVEVKQAYIDWMPPNTDLKIRMGLQGLALPSFTTGSNIFFDDVAAVALNYKFNDNVAITALWARPFNDNFGGGTYLTGSGANRYRQQNFEDNVDVAAIILPLTFDGVKVSPWIMGAIIGSNFAGTAANGQIGAVPTNSGSQGYVLPGMLPAGGARHKDGTQSTKLNNGYATAIWAGLTGEVTAFDPFRIAWDINYGATSWDDGRLNRAGWLASLLFEYKLDWGIPGLYGWYASGDDDDPSNGSERLPALSNANNQNGFSSFAFNGQPWIPGNRDAVLSHDMSGTWGIGVRLKDVSFVEDLKHTLRVNFMGGTNDPSFAHKYLRGNVASARGFANSANAGANSGGIGMDGLYMTKMDYALELGLSNVYKVYENFQIYFEGSYIATWMDSGVWKGSRTNGRDRTIADPWNINLSFIYSF